MKDEISQEAKAALANAAKVRRMRRLDRDGCSKSDAVRRRLRYIAAERKLEPADIAKIIMRRLRLDDLAGFAQQHGISMDWLMFGDISRAHVTLPTHHHGARAGFISGATPASSPGNPRMVKKLKLQEAWAISAFGVASPLLFCDDQWRPSRIGREGRLMDLARILAYVTGTVDQEVLTRNAYLAAENRILKAQLKGRLKLSDAERATLGEIPHRVGRKVLAEVAAVARPDTILAWYRKRVACKFDGSEVRHGPGRPQIKREVEQLIVRMAGDNRDWGYDRIVGALANLGYMISDQTVGNVLQRHALPPAPERKRTTTWPVFIRTHLALLAGTDFFTAEVLTLRGLVTYYVLFFIRLESRRVDIAGITIHPGELWMKQIARNVTMEGCGVLRDCRYLLVT
jgi:hypothetical protein